MVNQKASADAVPSTEQISVKGVLATAQSEAKKAQNQVALLQQKHDILEGGFRNHFDKVKDDWKEKVGAWLGKAVEAKNTLDKIWLVQS